MDAGSLATVFAPSGPMPRKPTDSRASASLAVAADAKRASSLNNLRNEMDRLDKELSAVH